MTNITNPFEKDSYELKQIFSNLVKYKSDCEAKIKKTEQAIGFSNGMVFKPLEKLSYNLKSFESIRCPNYNYVKISLEKFEEIVTKEIECFRLYLDSNKESRALINAHNANVFDTVVGLMAKIGISPTYDVYEFKTSRSRERTKITKTAGFWTDLTRVKPSDNWSTLNNQLIDYERRAKEYIASEKQKEIKETEASYQKAIDKYWLKNMELSSKMIEIGINPITFITDNKNNPKVFNNVNILINEALDEKLEEITLKDKYLYLASCLEANRNDWSDGYDYAQKGLDHFTIDTPLDSEINDCIQGLIDNWDRDGRVFRDCEYSYDVLYGIANKEIMKEYTKVVELQSNWKAINGYYY